MNVPGYAPAADMTAAATAILLHVDLGRTAAGTMLPATGCHTERFCLRVLERERNGKQSRLCEVCVLRFGGRLLFGVLVLVIRKDWLQAGMVGMVW